MAELLLKDVSEETVRRLERRALAHGRSVEAEHRTLLERALGEAEAADRSMTMAEWLSVIRNSPLAEVDDEMWDEILARKDAGRSLEW